MIRRTPTGYSADVPDLPGCVATGPTVERTRQRIAEAVGMHVKLMRQTGEDLPEPRKAIEFAVGPAGGEEFCTWVDVRVPQPVSP
jgi:predicted RNase H-like HicB family nuclease